MSVSLGHRREEQSSGPLSKDEGKARAGSARMSGLHKLGIFDLLAVVFGSP